MFLLCFAALIERQNHLLQFPIIACPHASFLDEPERNPDVPSHHITFAPFAKPL
jgi:hypothetical protein